MDETAFLFNEEWEESRKDMQDILGEIKDPETAKSTFVLETFTRACAFSFVKEKPKTLSLQELKKTFAQRKSQELIRKFPIPELITPQPQVPQPQAPSYKPQGPKKPDRDKRKKRRLEETPLYIHKDIIKDKITSKVLASVDVTDRYMVNEPELNEADLLVLDKITKKKKIKNMEKGWKLIQKYRKKFKIQEGHDTNIKYYVVNDLFGMGRIEPLLHDSQISAIYCENYSDIKVDFQNKKLETNLQFASPEELKSFIVQVSHKLGEKINKNNPTIDGSFRGFSFHLTLGENLDNPSFIIKRIS